MRAVHVVYAYFPADPRVRREVDALQAAGHEVDVVCLRAEGESPSESVRGTRVTRVPLTARRGGRLRYAFQYGIFFLLSAILISILHRRRRFDVVHIHSLPDFQVFCSLPLKLRGVRVILDLHEALPEIVAARFRTNDRAPLVRLATLAERASVLFADHVITVNDVIGKLLVDRAGRGANVTVVMNSPDHSVVRLGDASSLKRRLGLNSDVIIVYVGGINPERDLPTLIRAVADLRSRHSIQTVIAGYGDPEYIDSLKRLTRTLQLSDSVVFLPRIPQEEVLTYLALSSFGVISYEDSPLTQVAIPTKVFEYAAVGKPLAVARLHALAELFDGAAEFFRAGDASDLAAAIERLLQDQRHADRLVERASAVLARCSWDIMKERLLSVYERIEGVPG